jgi:hypothetical protein
MSSSIETHLSLRTGLALNFGKRYGWVTRNKYGAWINVVEQLMSIKLVNIPDRFSRRLTSSGSFSVKSMYADFMNEHT